MSAKVIEVLLLSFVGVACVWDGVRLIMSPGLLGSRQSGSYVALLGSLILVLAIAYWLSAWVPQVEGEARVDGRRVLVAFGILAAYALTLGQLGYVVSTVLFFALYLRIYGSYPWTGVVIASIAFGAGTSYLWTQLGILLPPGVFAWP